MPLPRELHVDLVNPNIAAPVVLVPISLDVSETADVTVAAFVANRRMKLIAASYIMESDASSIVTYTCLLQNGTGTVAMSTALDIKALAADTGADFVGIPAGDAAILADGDSFEVFFESTGGGTTAPDRVGILCEFQLLT